MDKKVHKLKIKSKPDFLLVGISSHENDYRLSWAVNNSFGFTFNRIQNLQIFSEIPGESQEFSVYEYQDEEAYIRYNLVSNRCDNGFLLPEYKNIDFYLVIYGKITDQELNIIVDTLKNIEIITTAFQISDLSSKSLMKFIIH